MVTTVLASYTVPFAAQSWYRLPERDAAPLKGAPVVAGGAVVPGGGAVVGRGAVVGGGAFVAGPPTEMVKTETQWSYC